MSSRNGRRLDLSRNYLNGALSSMCANLANLVEIKLDGKSRLEQSYCFRAIESVWRPSPGLGKN